VEVKVQIVVLQMAERPAARVAAAVVAEIEN